MYKNLSEASVLKKIVSFIISLLLFCGISSFAASYPICKESTGAKPVIFTADEFKTSFSGGELDRVRFSVLPETYLGTLKLNGKPVKELSDIKINDVSKLSFIPNDGIIGSVVFLWNGAPLGGEFSDSASTVTIFISSEETAKKQNANNTSEKKTKTSVFSKIWKNIHKLFSK